MTTIALLNVKYSPNLGDGIIAECLENEIRRLLPGADVVSVDLAGREAFGTGLDGHRGAVLAFLDTLPRGLRSLTVPLAVRALIRLRYRSSWQRLLRRAGYAVLGGGQLLADADLNFPLKIDGVMQEVRKRGIPTAIFGVGVAENMSRRGHALFADAFSNARLAHVATRDRQSQANWNARFEPATKMSAKLCCDPGLLCCDLYRELRPQDRRQAPTVGLGITHPRTLALHGGSSGNPSSETAQAFWIELCRMLRARGHAVELFTTGPADDTEFLQAIYRATRELGVSQAPRPRRPAELARTIARFDAVAAHRLHANIIAYSFCIPNVALRWDRKVDAFMTSVGRERFVADAAEDQARLVANAIEKALSEGVDRSRHGQTLDAARVSIESCLSALMAKSPDVADERPSEVEDALRPRPAAG